MRKYNTILSILLIAASAVGIHLSLNFDVRGGNVGDPGAAFWPIMLCGGLILCSVILLVQTALEAKKATAPEAPLIDFATAGVHCVLIIFVIMIAYGTTRAKVNTKLERVLPSKSDLVTIFPTLIRSSLIGTLIGAIPGTGGDIASWVGYNEAKRWSKHPEQFGDGAPDGIAAPESANNAISGGALIPLLSLGIPGDACTAIMLGCLMMLGITPGPLLMTEQPAKVYMIIVGLFFANAFMALCGFAGIRIFTKISSVPSIVLTPLIFVFCFVGTFAVNHTVGDIYLMILCGILGFFLIKMEFSIPPIILGLILGGILEKNFRRAMVLSAGDWTTFFTRPISCVFIIIAFLSLIYPFVLAHLKQRKAAKKGEQA